MPELEYRAKLRNTTNPKDLVVFKVSPEIVESRNVNYKTVDPIHAPGQIYAFVNSSSRTFNLSGVKLVSRTVNEAEINLIHLWRLRSWTLPAFGKDPLTSDQRENRRLLASVESHGRERGLPNDDLAAAVEQARETLGGTDDVTAFGADLRGAPPNVLYFSAYSHDGHLGNKAAHINRVPVVITSLNIPYPIDADYFPTSSGVPMPTIMSIDITLAETHSPREYQRFSLTRFKQGKLGGF